MRPTHVDEDEIDVPLEVDPLEEDDDERPDSFEDKDRRKEMRKGIDLATTLERIEKNFVITDPRLPDNPIVRLELYYYFNAIFINQSMILWKCKTMA